MLSPRPVLPRTGRAHITLFSLFPRFDFGCFSFAFSFSFSLCLSVCVCVSLIYTYGAFPSFPLVQHTVRTGLGKQQKKMRKEKNVTPCTMNVEHKEKKEKKKRGGRRRKAQMFLFLFFSCLCFFMHCRAFFLLFLPISLLRVSHSIDTGNFSRSLQ